MKQKKKNVMVIKLKQNDAEKNMKNSHLNLLHGRNLKKNSNFIINIECYNEYDKKKLTEGLFYFSIFSASTKIYYYTYIYCVTYFLLFWL